MDYNGNSSYASNEALTQGDPVASVCTVRVNDNLVATLDQMVIIRDYPSRDALVNAVLSDFLSREKQVSQDGVYSQRIWSETLTGPSNSGPDKNEGDHPVTFEVGLHQVGLTSQPRKRVFITRHLRWSEGREPMYKAFSFSAAALPWVRQTFLPWLTLALESAENAYQDDTRTNRKRARDLRDERTDLEKSEEDQARRHYTALYGKAVWNTAVAQASRHRARAVHRGLTQHFTQIEWILLAARAGFRCAECKAEEPLESHHIKALSDSGTNTIGNIHLLCQTCHITISERGEDLGAEWYENELQEARRFAIGDRVRRTSAYSTRATDRGEIIALLPPQKGDGPFYCRRPMGARWTAERDHALKHHFYQLFPSRRPEGYEAARVRVRWTRKKSGKVYEEDELPKNLSLCA